MKIKISAVDKLFSLYIRTRDGWICQRCFTKYEPPTNGLHCAHCFTRGSKSTRFDPANAAALCYGCHLYVDSHPYEKYDFFIGRLGKKSFDSLHMRSKIPMKIDMGILKFALKKMLKDLEPKEEIYGAR